MARSSTVAKARAALPLRPCFFVAAHSVRQHFEDRANHARYDTTDFFGMDTAAFRKPCDEEFWAGNTGGGRAPRPRSITLRVDEEGLRCLLFHFPGEKMIAIAPARGNIAAGGPAAAPGGIHLGNIDKVSKDTP